jgi:Uma2 family endonuclease
MTLPTRTYRRKRKPSLITADQLLAMVKENPYRYELDAGYLVVGEPGGFLHSDVGMELATRLRTYVRTHHLGRVLGPDGGYLLFTNPDTVRAPDVSFVATGRIPPGPLTQKYFPGVPDLAVEILSPNDRPGDLKQKIDEYFRAGVRLVWVIDPTVQTVTVRYPTGNMLVLQRMDVLDGEHVVPGFRCSVGALFVLER